jgi:hypothetical protein
LNPLDLLIDLWLLFHANEMLYNHGKGKSEDSLDYVVDLRLLFHADAMLYIHGKGKSEESLTMWLISGSCFMLMKWSRIMAMERARTH